MFIDMYVCMHMHVNYHTNINLRELVTLPSTPVAKGVEAVSRVRGPVVFYVGSRDKAVAKKPREPGAAYAKAE